MWMNENFSRQFFVFFHFYYLFIIPRRLLLCTYLYNIYFFCFHYRRRYNHAGRFFCSRNLAVIILRKMDSIGKCVRSCNFIFMIIVRCFVLHHLWIGNDCEKGDRWEVAFKHKSQSRGLVLRITRGISKKSLKSFEGHMKKPLKYLKVEFYKGCM